MPGNRTVLVVEDDQEINELVGAYVQIAGFHYQPALDGAAALQQAHHARPDLIVLDLMLPDTDGFEICRRLKSHPDTCSIPVIMLTALEGEEDRRRGQECGADQYLTKPFDPDQLMATLRGLAHPNGQH